MWRVRAGAEPVLAAAAAHVGGSGEGARKLPIGDLRFLRALVTYMRHHNAQIRILAAGEAQLRWLAEGHTIEEACIGCGCRYTLSKVRHTGTWTCGTSTPCTYDWDGFTGNQ
jgi:hypothetical protein